MTAHKISNYRPILQIYPKAPILRESGLPEKVSVYFLYLKVVGASSRPLIVLLLPIGRQYAAFEASLCALLLYPIARFVISLYDRGTDSYACALRSVASIMYIALPLAALNLAYVAFSEGKWLVLLR